MPPLDTNHADLPAPSTDEREAPAPKYMTADETEQAMAKREKRFLARIERTIGERFADLQKPAPGTDVDDERLPPSSDPRVARLERQLADERRERRAERKAREEQAAETRRTMERRKFTEAFGAAGGDPKMLRGALALLHAEERKVRTNEDGRVVFMVDDDEEIDLAEGVKRFLASDEGRPYMAPRGARSDVAKRPASKEEWADRKLRAHGILLPRAEKRPAPSIDSGAPRLTKEQWADNRLRELGFLPRR